MGQSENWCKFFSQSFSFLNIFLSDNFLSYQDLYFDCVPWNKRYILLKTYSRDYSEGKDIFIIKSYFVSYLSIKFPRYDGSSSDQFWRSLIAFKLSQLLIKRLAVAMLNRLLFSQWNSSKFSKLFINKIFLIESSFTAVRPPKSIFLSVEPEHWAIFR